MKESVLGGIEHEDGLLGWAYIKGGSYTCILTGVSIATYEMSLVSVVHTSTVGVMRYHMGVS